MDKTKEYSNGEVTIVWKQNLCTHSAICLRGLPEVFYITKVPLINAHAASTDEIINQVKECPSGALSFYLNNNKQKEDNILSDVKVSLLKDGPILIKGKIELKNSKGEVIPTKTSVALCRCGASKNKPFCDGEHTKIGFKE